MTEEKATPGTAGDQKWEGEILGYENIMEMMKNEEAPSGRKFTEALELSVEVLEHTKKEGDKVALVRILQGVVGIIQHYKQFEKTMALYNDIYDISKQIFGADHLDTLSVQRNIDQVLDAQQKLDQAVTLHQQIWEATKRGAAEGPVTPKSALEIWNLSHIFQTENPETDLL